VILQISLLFLLSIHTGYYQMENTGNKEMKHKSFQTILVWSRHTCPTVIMDLGSILVIMIKFSYKLFQLKLLKFDHRITESQNVRGWKGPLWVI